MKMLARIPAKSRVFEWSTEMALTSRGLQEADLYVRLLRYRVQTSLFMYAHRPHA